MPRMITVDADIIQNGLTAFERSWVILLWAFSSHGCLTSEDADILLGDSSPSQGDNPLALGGGFLRDRQSAADHVEQQSLAALGWEGAEIGEPRALLWLINHLTVSDRAIRKLWIE